MRMRPDIQLAEDLDRQLARRWPRQGTFASDVLLVEKHCEPQSVYQLRLWRTLSIATLSKPSFPGNHWPRLHSAN